MGDSLSYLDNLLSRTDRFNEDECLTPFYYIVFSEVRASPVQSFNFSFDNDVISFPVSFSQQFRCGRDLFRKAI